MDGEASSVPDEGMFECYNDAIIATFELALSIKVSMEILFNR